ncbi:MAG: hypoxanthine/guanine phosphoribosyltransferase [Methanomassiliicoccus sp.]|nr:hypoxanthine/guanine phosphoribosyltransferase [Methanomassiliicoccus sp.]
MPAPEARLPLLRSSVERSPVVKREDYSYVVTPITDGVPRVDPLMLAEITDGIMAVADLDCDLILGPEAMGIPVAVSLSLRTGIPYAVVRKRRYGLPGEVELEQVTGYSRCTMYLNGVGSGDRVVIVDDIVSTGGTLRCVVSTLRRVGVRIVDVVAVLEKGGARPALERELGVRIKTLLRVEVRNGRAVVSEPLPADENG